MIFSQRKTRCRSSATCLSSGAFSGRTETSSKRTLFVFLRPTILRDRADVSALSQQRYDRVQTLDQMGRDEDSLLLEGKAPKLPLELEGIY